MYLQETKDDDLTLHITNMTMSDWYVDADFAVHADMKSHKGSVLTMGKESIQTILMNQKFNAKVSTEA